MRQSIAALALISRFALNGERQWLTQWNHGWQALNLVGGHKHDDESFRNCCLREIAEELGLVPDRDLGVAVEPIHLEYTADSKSAGMATQYIIELFPVEWLSDDASAKIDANPDNAWIGEREMRSKRADDGRTVSDTVELLLRKAGYLQAED